MAANDPEEAPGGGEDPRLASLDERLKAAHHAEAHRNGPAQLPLGMGGKGAVQLLFSLTVPFLKAFCFK